jgi:hypothetical protein
MKLIKMTLLSALLITSYVANSKTLWHQSNQVDWYQMKDNRCEISNDKSPEFYLQHNPSYRCAITGLRTGITGYAYIEIHCPASNNNFRTKFTTNYEACEADRRNLEKERRNKLQNIEEKRFQEEKRQKKSNDFDTGDIFKMMLLKSMLQPQPTSNTRSIERPAVKYYESQDSNDGIGNNSLVY